VRSKLPVIVGFGGYNAAGRSSFHHGFRRCIFESLNSSEQDITAANLACMMNLPKEDITNILNGTLIRSIENSYFDSNNLYLQQKVTLKGDDAPISFRLEQKTLPNPIPHNWTVTKLDDYYVQVVVDGDLLALLPSTRNFSIKTAGQLPTGFDPAQLYNSRFHPRGLQLAIIGASDALHSTGLNWHKIMQQVAPNQIAVFGGSAMSQLDEFGFGNMMQARLKGGRVTAKNCPLGLSTMPADFINAYVLGNLGNTGGVTGACATFLYNLQKAIEQINYGKARIVIVGNSEAPITPEILEGYGAMNALASSEGLQRIGADARTASRPFGENCGFIIAESTQYVVLMDDELALELGANIYGAVTDIFINADGFKKSISAPGVGNYLTMAQAVASASNLFGDNLVQNRSFVHSHGSSTPANRVTESQLLNEVAQAFNIENWPVVAIKAYVGHSLSAASADQLISALGSFAYDILPGIKTIPKVADDVIQDRLSISLQDQYRATDVCFINAKGFGGNNATGVVVSPNLANQMIEKRYGKNAYSEYCKKREQTHAKAVQYDESARIGQFNVIYNFGQNMLDGSNVSITKQQVNIDGVKSLEFVKDLRFQDML